MHHGEGFIFIFCLGVVEASHLCKLHLRRTAFGIKSYRDLNKFFRQENVYIKKMKIELKENELKKNELKYVSHGHLGFSAC